MMLGVEGTADRERESAGRHDADAHREQRRQCRPAGPPQPPRPRQRHNFVHDGMRSCAELCRYSHSQFTAQFVRPHCNLCAGLL